MQERGGSITEPWKTILKIYKILQWVFYYLYFTSYISTSLWNQHITILFYQAGKNEHPIFTTL